jgi:hypothetical protein
MMSREALRDYRSGKLRAGLCTFCKRERVPGSKSMCSVHIAYQRSTGAMRRRAAGKRASQCSRCLEMGHSVRTCSMLPLPKPVRAQRTTAPKVMRGERMVMKTCYPELEQYERLFQIASATKVPASVFIRQGIDLILTREGYIAPTYEDCGGVEP